MYYLILKYLILLAKNIFSVIGVAIMADKAATKSKNTEKQGLFYQFSNFF